MSLTVTAKIRILPTEKEAALLLETSHAYRKACNYISEYIFRTHKLAMASVNQAIYHELREQFGLRSQMAQSAIKTVIAKYKTIRENQGEWIQPTFKRPQLDLVWNRDYSLNKNRFSVNTLKGRVQLVYINKAMEQYFDGTWKFGTAKLVLKHGKWYLHISMTSTRHNPADILCIDNIVGVDFGINFLATSYDSKGKTTFINGRDIKQKRAHYKEVRRSLQQRGTPSARRRLLAIGSREHRWMNDVNHCASKALVKQNPKNTLFVVEDLTGIRSVTEKVRRKDRYVSVSWAFYDLRCKLHYKAIKYGSIMISVEPAYTSQRCPKCGHIEKSNRNRKTHSFCCKSCGYKSNDDRVGAMNLHNKGIEYLYAVTSKHASA